jgi:uncharacterized membrane protein YeaQ/YmgE (transglycosylase-associated protein family)
MNDLRSFVTDPFVTLILIIAIGAIIGWIYEQQTHSPHGYITSALVGVAGAYTGFHLAALVRMAHYATTVRLLAAAAGALIVLWGWRNFHLHPKRAARRR